MGVYDQLPCGSCQHHASKSVELTHTSMLALNEVLRSPPLWTPLSLSINRGLTHTSLLSHGGGQTLSSAQVPSDTTGGNESRVPASTACHHLFYLIMPGGVEAQLLTRTRDGTSHYLSKSHC